MNLKDVRILLFLPVFALLLMNYISASAKAEGCDESFELGDTTYSIPERWCGQMIDSGLIANPETLVRIPESLSWKKYRIYLGRETRTALNSMAAEAEVDSVSLLVQSGYRSARYQRVIIRKRLDQGQTIETVLKYVAPPGYSEHETGMAVDMISADGPFEKSRAYQWLKLHANEFGFIESIPEDSTGTIPWEPWHWYYNPESK